MSAWLAVLAVVAQLTPLQSADKPRIETSGQVLLLADFLPRRDVSEGRPRAEVDVTLRPSDAIRVKVDAFAEGLIANRNGQVTEVIAGLREAWFETSGTKGDVRAGFGRLAWGRLDEIQPSDVINPLDTARFLFDGRGAARLAVGFVRGRVFASEKLTLEGVLVPFFRRGTFDELQEASSPFNLLNDVVPPSSGAVALPQLIRKTPGTRWSNISGGGRASGTIGRVDLAGGIYTGFEGFGVITGDLVQRFPRFTMISGDFETVIGEWVWRGETAVFVDKPLPGSDRLGVVPGRAVDAGVGFDRKTGSFRLFGSAILHREWSPADVAVDRTDVSLVGSIERQFNRDRYMARLFAVFNPGDRSSFVRGLLAWSVRDNLSMEASGATFLGDGDDTLARFKTRDFAIARIRWRF